MLSIFDHMEYRSYLEAWIEAQGAQGYGLKGRIAQQMGISSSLLSQVLKGDKSFTPDQASDLADFLGLTEIDADYLQLLVDYDRAGTHRYREKLKKKIHLLQQQSRKIGKRVGRDKELTDEQKAIYYSSWIYTGIRNLSAVPEFGQAEAVAKALKLELPIVNRVLRFLLETGLCKEVDGALTYAVANTHLDSDSPFVNKHHQNWRFQAIQHMERRSEDDLFYTAPMSLSRAAADDIRKLLPTVIQSILKVSGPSPSETVACLNIDWFGY